MSRPKREAHGKSRRRSGFGVELSGLERPRQWLGAVLAVLGIVLTGGLIAFIAFG